MTETMSKLRPTLHKGARKRISCSSGPTATELRESAGIRASELAVGTVSGQAEVSSHSPSPSCRPISPNCNHLRYVCREGNDTLSAFLAQANGPEAGEVLQRHKLPKIWTILVRAEADADEVIRLRKEVARLKEEIKEKDSLIQKLLDESKKLANAVAEWRDSG